MTPAHLLALWQVETRKLLSRTLGRLGLVVAVIVALLAPMVLASLDTNQGTLNGRTIGDMVDATAPMALIWTLYLRNFFVTRLLIAALGALSIAGEFQARTLREDLVQPVPRWSVIVAKWGALSTWIAVGAALSWLVASLLGAILFGTGGEWTDAATGWVVAVLCDVGFATVVLAVSVWLRSVAGTLVGVVAFLIADTLLGWALTVLDWLGQVTEVPAAVEIAIQARPWLPSAAFGLWSSWAGGEPWVWQSFAALALITAVSLALAIARLARLDVP